MRLRGASILLLAALFLQIGNAYGGTRSFAPKKIAVKLRQTIQHTRNVWRQKQLTRKDNPPFVSTIRGTFKSVVGPIFKSSIPFLKKVPAVTVRRGSFLGSGNCKNAEVVTIATGTHKGQESVMLTFKPAFSSRVFNQEVKNAGAVAKLGLPTVPVLGRTTLRTRHGRSRHALIVKKMAADSRALVKMWRLGNNRELMESPLSHKSVVQLKQILRTMKKKQLRIPDLQFLVGADGSIAINDIAGPPVHKPPRKKDLRQLHGLLQAAERTLTLRQQSKGAQ